ncbi:MAG: hypothetical protein HXX08_11605 [Chloroflexi bacterium]|uniref:Uncharacterized protein n=1 Tax=Candidatus Chlorohelix allophototropha TaxID=3003348 RepID=A0A8T7M3N8_9CHLR|nr:hypothetical protein [Chloroflexota bacterium]WJW65884.1 hypothetical protein OZ401_001664 [Chloroflexota bacterium L227-S17]
MHLSPAKRAATQYTIELTGHPTIQRVRKLIADSQSHNCAVTSLIAATSANGRGTVFASRSSPLLSSYEAVSRDLGSPVTISLLAFEYFAVV